MQPHLLDATMFWSASGGVRRVIATKRAMFSAHGWRHTLLAPGADGPGEIDCGGWRLPASGGYRFVLARARAARLIERARPDLVEAADPYLLGWAALDAAERLRVPAVAFCHSHLPNVAARLLGGRGSARGRWAATHARRYLAGLYARYDLVLAPSRWMTQALHDWGIPQALHQPLGVDCAVFTPQRHDPAWRRRLEDWLQLPRGTQIVVFTGRFAPEKHLQVLADAVAHLGPGHALLAVGAGPCPPRGDRVRVLGPEEDDRRLARLLANCDAFAHAGDEESFGLAALEAMACGTPIVVSAAAGLGELAQGVGLTVASQRPADWAEALRSSLGSPASLMTRPALHRALEHDWPVVLDRLARRYRQAMHAQQRPEARAEPPPRTAPSPAWGSGR